MGLTTSLGNALTGMRVNQDALSVISRNVSNAGTPGYHRQALNVVDQWGSSAYLTTEVDRSFNESLQKYYMGQVSDTSYANTRSSFLNTLQTYLGKVGDVNSLDTLYGELENSIQNLSTSPDDYAARAKVVADAQTMASRLNALSHNIQDMRLETEGQISSSVDTINNSLKSLEDVNRRIMTLSNDSTTRSSLLDQRDRLVATISEQVDINVTYRDNGSVAIMTKSGTGLLDQTASVLNFDAAGGINANSQFSKDPALNGVGVLTITTPAGGVFDLVQNKGLRSGQLAALVELRDKTLVDAQSQLDQIAAGLAKAFSTITTPGTAVTDIGDGFEVDLASMQSGDDFLLNYTEGGETKSVRVINVADTTKLPMDYMDAKGQRVVGMDFSAGPATVAADLQALVGGGLTVSNPTGDMLRIVDDAGGVTTDVNSLVTHKAVTADQDAGLAVSLFVDANNKTFTGSLDGIAQQSGFAERISVNAAILANNAILVQAETGGSLGDASRANYLLDQLNSLTFTGAAGKADAARDFKLSGNVSNLISQTMNYQGDVIATALDNSADRELALESLNERLDSEYGVDVDNEMARLMQLQTSYAANARVMSVIQELLDAMMQM